MSQNKINTKKKKGTTTTTIKSKCILIHACILFFFIKGCNNFHAEISDSWLTSATLTLVQAIYSFLWWLCKEKRYLGVFTKSQKSLKLHHNHSKIAKPHRNVDSSELNRTTPYIYIYIYIKILKYILKFKIINK